MVKTGVKVVTVNELKICGIWYCNNLEREYKLNIRDKIDKLKSKIRLWKSRNLTFEGRSLIIKTFGLSQLIYGLQVYPLREESVKEIEGCIFGFLWIGCKSNAERGVDRIKRAVLKNEYAEGGLNMTDIECLDKSLKLRQFIRAGRSSHPIRVIQQYCLEQLGYKDVVQQEYHSITKKEGVTRSAQITINDICDYTRESIKMDLERYVNNIIATNLIASINIRTYLLRQNKILVQCLYTPLRNDGIEKLHELCTEEEIERERERLKRIRMVTVNFPVELIEIAGAYDENVNRDSLGLTHILMKDGSWKEIDKITTKELQWILKSALGKIESQDFCRKLGIDSFDKENIMKFRRQCKNVKLRHIYYRLISKDFFAKDRMYNRRMVSDNICLRCGGIETYRHLIWECNEARRIWRVYNEYMDSIGHSEVKVEVYEEVFKVENISAVSTVKMKIIQEMIQIIRPISWNDERMKDIVMTLKSTELYNAGIVRKLDKVRLKWSMMK